jgi:hypothetical protein
VAFLDRPEDDLSLLLEVAEGLLADWLEGACGWGGGLIGLVLAPDSAEREGKTRGE